MSYYVYIYYRQDVPFYVGMGKNLRDRSHLSQVKKGKGLKNPHLENTIKKMLREDQLPHIVRVAGGLTEEDAKRLEVKLIAEHGRADLGKGPLTNMTDGGDGYVGWSPEARARLSAKKKGKTNVRDSKGNIFAVAVDDPRLLSGELVGQNRGKKTATGSMKGLVQARLLDGTSVRVPKTDPRFQTGELAGINRGRKASLATLEKMSASMKGKPQLKPAGFSETMRRVALKR